ncbi:hypothetical protein CYPRO_0672 [Cyclonatronum proteinivorum]|uniref:Transposase n=1 Tax=Cyclonatronum proteinivorum TaxID=1457365 RepID=A0A345UHK4_9BACT|nr:hypothetical protein [Cyclonatronum proteinivorum]AXI99955.1 hypothetical protein CYPRO_0672 [Cyclonatronum proteinivorum]
MEKELLHLFLPAGLLDRFEIERFEQSRIEGSAIASTLHIYLVEKNQLPPGYAPDEWESKGFCESKTIQDFAIRTNLVYLVFRRRRWRSKSDPNHTITSDLAFLAKGAKMTAELSAFLKGTGQNP